MRSLLLVTVLSLTTTSSAFPSTNNPPSDPQLTVKTTSGTFTGFVQNASSSHPDVNQWLGIPYGAPPVGSLRFMPPQKAPDHGPADAKSYKPICPQNSGNKTGAFWELMPEFQNWDPESEDCLYLNIWGPRKPVPVPGVAVTTAVAERPLVPVIIWVCGGAFREGGGHAPYQVPDSWIQRTQTHMVVAFNARLNIFGFPGAGPNSTAKYNAGLMDVRLAVEWLRDNIAQFGGDPERMVLYGQSAGSGTVWSYTYAYPDDVIVTGLIAVSAGPPVINPDGNEAFHEIARGLCGNMTSAEGEVQCMQKVDWKEIKRIVDDGGYRFGPIADGVTLFGNLTERLEKGLVAKVPAITGFTFNEFAAFLPFDINNTTAPAAASETPTIDFFCGVEREANKRTLNGLITYRYLYSGNFTNITPRYWLGGMHSSDIPIVFGTHNIARGNSTELEWQTSFAMESFWVTFAANSSADPHDHKGLAWPKYTLEDTKIVVFGNQTGESESYVAPVSVSDYWTGPC